MKKRVTNVVKGYNIKRWTAGALAILVIGMTTACSHKNSSKVELPEEDTFLVYSNYLSLEDEIKDLELKISEYIDYLVEEKGYPSDYVYNLVGKYCNKIANLLSDIDDSNYIYWPDENKEDKQKEILENEKLALEKLQEIDGNSKKIMEVDVVYPGNITIDDVLLKEYLINFTLEDIQIKNEELYTEINSFLKAKIEKYSKIKEYYKNSQNSGNKDIFSLQTMNYILDDIIKDMEQKDITVGSVFKEDETFNKGYN